MKIKITAVELEEIKDMALTEFKDKHNLDIDSTLYPTLCYLKSIEAFLQRHNIIVEFVTDERSYDEPLDNL